MVMLRRLMGEALRARRQDQGRTLRDVAASARVSLGYLSEVERGRKEPSSELLASICGALDVPLSEVLREVSDVLVVEEALAVGVPATIPADVTASVTPLPTAPAQVRLQVGAAA